MSESNYNFGQLTIQLTEYDNKQCVANLSICSGTFTYILFESKRMKKSDAFASALFFIRKLDEDLSSSRNFVAHMEMQALGEEFNS